ncbi:MAG: hypothetical protein RSA78_08340, partial [Oscillospiraceae bacterium]
MWITPKTNWTKDDTFNISPDYERIRGNILYLKAEAVKLYLSFTLNVMADYAMTDLPYAEFFNNVEDNLRLIYDKTYKRVNYSTRALRINEPIWDWRDLVRIESMTLQI